MQISASKLEEDGRLKDMMRRREPQIICWLYENGLPMNWKEHIMKNAEDKLGPYQEVNLTNIDHVLPMEWRKSMVLTLCLPTIKKVSFSIYIYNCTCVRIYIYILDLTNQSSFFF